MIAFRAPNQGLYYSFRLWIARPKVFFSQTPVSCPQVGDELIRGNNRIAQQALRDIEDSPRLHLSKRN